MMELSPRYELLASKIEAKIGDKLSRSLSSTGQLTYELPPTELAECCRFLRDTDGCKFEMLMDLCGIDYLEYGKTEWDTAEATNSGFSRGVQGGASDDGELRREGDAEYFPKGRFAVIYQLLSITCNHRIQLKTFCEDDEYPIVDSVISIWNCANWFEREAFDLFGILYWRYARIAFRGFPKVG